MGTFQYSGESDFWKQNIGLSIFDCDSCFFNKDMCSAVFKYNQLKNVRRHLSLCCLVNATDLGCTLHQKMPSKKCCLLEWQFPNETGGVHGNSIMFVEQYNLIISHLESSTSGVNIYS